MEAHAPVRTSTSRSRFVHVSLSSSCVECTSTWLHPTCAAPRVSRTRRVPVEGAIGCRRPEGPPLAHPLHASDRRRQHSQLRAHLPQPHWARPCHSCAGTRRICHSRTGDGCGSAPLHCDPRCAQGCGGLSRHYTRTARVHRTATSGTTRACASARHEPTIQRATAAMQHTPGQRASERARQRQACKVACAVARS